MNQMTMKLAEAGVPLPTQNKRVWQCAKDHPGSSGARIAQILGLSQSAVTSLLSDMIKRGMVRRESQVRSVKGPRGSVTKRDVWVYHAIGNEFELLPKKTQLPPPRHQPKPAPAPVPAPAAPVRDTVTLQDPPPTVNQAAAFVGKLTLAEACALYAELDRVFGGKK